MRKNKKERNEYLREYRAKKGYHRSDVTHDNLSSIAERLVDPEWRPRLESIYESLGDLSKEVFLDGITLDMWGELLSITQ